MSSFTTINIRQLERRMEKIAEGVRPATSKVVRNVAFAIGAVAIDLTPVDEGIARSNWQGRAESDPAVPVREPFDRLEKRTDPSKFGEEANRQGAKKSLRSELNRIPARELSVAVVNPVPYVEDLNNGTTRTVAPTPLNFVQVAVASAKRAVEAEADTFTREFVQNIRSLPRVL